MKRTSPITVLFAAVAIIAAVVAIQAQSSDSDAKPAVVEVERVAPATAPAATPPAAAQPETVHTASKAAASQPAQKAQSVQRRTVVRVAVPPLRSLAAADCREEAFDDAAEFRFEYGTGQAGMNRCIRYELRKARIDCQSERIEDPFEYRAEYGTGSLALRRCMRDSMS
jgi:hypothetical protein